jgi:hypothetical protein
MRSIPTDIASTTSNNRLGVLQYDPETKRLAFAPATYSVVNNKKVANVRLLNHPYLVVVDAVRTFTDIGNSPAKTDIEVLAAKRLLNGTSSTTFSPNNFVTRAEFTAMMVNALGLPANSGQANFKDVKSTQWFAGVIGTAVKHKIVGGFTDGTFRPGDRITRTQMAVMLDNALRVAKSQVNVTSAQVTSSLGSYVDGKSVPAWAQIQIVKALRFNMMKGTRTSTGLSILPTAQVTRAEAASSIRNMLISGKLMN